jgi:hypothetical protein
MPTLAKKSVTKKPMPLKKITPPSQSKPGLSKLAVALTQARRTGMTTVTTTTRPDAKAWLKSPAMNKFLILA